MSDEDSDSEQSSGYGSPMDVGDGECGDLAYNSGGSKSGKPRVQLPASCDPPRPGHATKPLVWLVFGGTGHIGRSVVKSALSHGDYVTTVGRTYEMSPAAMQAMAGAIEDNCCGAAYRHDASSANAVTGAVPTPRDRSSSPSSPSSPPQQLPPLPLPLLPQRKERSPQLQPQPQPQRRPRPSPACLGELCDVRSRESVERVVRRTVSHFGRVDVVANCSGYGVVGACEDQDEHELRDQFETNVMGTLHILQATLPVLRQQHADQGGRYLIFSSTAGSLGVPGQGPFCATKYAVEGLIEAMLYEVDAFNIKATLVEPGLVRRDDNHVDGGGVGEAVASLNSSGGRDMAKQSAAAGAGRTKAAAAAAEAAALASKPLPMWGHFLIKPPSEPYAGATSPALHMTRMVKWLGDRQPTSVVQCAELVWQLAHCSFPPLRLPLGSYAIESIRDRLRSVTEELEDWKHLNFPMPPDPTITTAATAATGSAAAGAAASDGSPVKSDMADRADKTTDRTEKLNKANRADKTLQIGKTPKSDTREDTTVEWADEDRDYNDFDGEMVDAGSSSQMEGVILASGSSLP